jgi:uncharacterized protein (DUF1330 family)
MAKGYWIARMDVRNAEAYQHYVAALPAVMKKYGGRYLTRGGQFESLEGTNRSRNVVVEFASYEAALQAYRSPEYQQAAAVRKANAEGDFLVIEGYDGPQPADA